MAYDVISSTFLGGFSNSVRPRLTIWIRSFKERIALSPWG
jgi:hypothetical protein